MTWIANADGSAERPKLETMTAIEISCLHPNFFLNIGSRYC